MEDYSQAIGEAAGKIFRLLEKKGATPLNDVKKGSGVEDGPLFNQALGWLAREDKIRFNKEARGLKLTIAGS